MPEAFIYDAVRTPRGKGKRDGSLHSIKPIALVTGLIQAVLERNRQSRAVRDGRHRARLRHSRSVTRAPTSRRPPRLPRASPIPWQAPGQSLLRVRAGSGEPRRPEGPLRVRGFRARRWRGIDVDACRWDPTAVRGRWIPRPTTTPGSFRRASGPTCWPRSKGFREPTWTYSRWSHNAEPGRERPRLLLAQHRSRFATRTDSPCLMQDEFIKPNTTMEAMAKLQPSFQMMGEMGGFDAVALQKYHYLEAIDHVHTAGNSSGIVDGAALVLVGSDSAGNKLGLVPRGRIVATALSGADPTIMLTGPAPAARKALAKAGLEKEQIDLWEVNEAFASVVLRFIREMDLPRDIVNVNGGAIALGHPLGATGAMILGTLLDELERRDLRYGLCTLCVGGGMGIATIVERL